MIRCDEVDKDDDDEKNDDNNRNDNHNENRTIVIDNIARQRSTHMQNDLDSLTCRYYTMQDHTSHDTQSLCVLKIHQ